MRRLTVHEFTRIDLGIERGHEELASSHHIPSYRPVLILLTDGKANPGGPQAAVEAAERAKDQGITIFSIGLGTVDALDFEALTVIASRPEFAYRTADPDDLARIYSEIAHALPCQTR
jgi:Mg-chelatase subunit ChlD